MNESLKSNVLLNQVGDLLCSTSINCMSKISNFVSKYNIDNDEIVRAIQNRYSIEDYDKIISSIDNYSDKDRYIKRLLNEFLLFMFTNVLKQLGKVDVFSFNSKRVVGMDINGFLNSPKYCLNYDYSKITFSLTIPNNLDLQDKTMFYNSIRIITYNTNNSNDLIISFIVNYNGSDISNTIYTFGNILSDMDSFFTQYNYQFPRSDE